MAYDPDDLSLGSSMVRISTARHESAAEVLAQEGVSESARQALRVRVQPDLPDDAMREVGQPYHPSNDQRGRIFVFSNCSINEAA
jgi:hypothetical protein